jgi:CIC family chloride channel protein
MSEPNESDDVSGGSPRRRRATLSNLQLPSFDALAGFESTRYLGKWLLIGGLIGIVAGLGAVALIHGIQLATEFFLGRLVGYTPPKPLGEGNFLVDETIGRPWLLPFVTALGGLISGIIVFRFAPSAEGHGTDAAIEAILHRDGYVEPKVPPVKLIASAITIGSGGSAGREGPAAQISTGFASLLSGWLRLSPNDRRIAASAGMGSGIGAIFRAPLGGALMSAEILYLHDLEVEALIPGLIASIVGYSVFGAFEGWEPIFGQQSSVAFTDPTTLAYYALLGVAAGLVGILYAKCFYGVVHLFHKLHVPLWVKPAIGGFLVGLMGLLVKGSIHTGYGWVQISMSDQLLSLPLWIVLVLPFAKILATSFTVGSGGSGGIFGPGMVIGGMLGASFWRLGHEFLPHMPGNAAPFVIVGMMALFGSIAHAPFAVMLMVAEMTGNLSLLAPAMLAIAVATLLVGDRTIYTSQLPNRASAPAHRLRSSFPLLAALTVRNAFEPAKPAQPGTAPRGPSVDVRDRLDDAMLVMADADVSEVPVLSDGEVAGRLTYGDALRTYRSMIDTGLRRVDQLPATSLIMEFTVAEGAPVAGKPLREAGFPPEALVVSVAREGRSAIPIASTVLRAGDQLTVVGNPAQSDDLRILIEGNENGGQGSP